MEAGTEFSGLDDWTFASPAHIGRLPWSMDAVDDAYRKAAKAAGIGTVSTHTMRHYSDFRTIPGETGIRSAIDVMT